MAADGGMTVSPPLPALPPLRPKDTNTTAARNSKAATRGSRGQVPRPLGSTLADSLLVLDKAIADSAPPPLVQRQWIPARGGGRGGHRGRGGGRGRGSGTDHGPAGGERMDGNGTRGGAEKGVVHDVAAGRQVPAERGLGRGKGGRGGRGGRGGKVALGDTRFPPDNLWHGSRSRDSTAHTFGKRNNTKKKTPPGPPAPLDHTAFPHIIDLILADPASWSGMRTTCSMYRNRIQKMMYRHIILSTVYRDGPNLSRGADDEDSDDGQYDLYEVESELYAVEHLSEFSASDPMVIAVTSPQGPLPPFSPREYDNGWGNSTEDEEHLGRCSQLLEHTRVVDVPIGLLKSDVKWFQNELSNLEVIRYRYDPDLENRNTYEEEYADDVMKAPTVVLVPGSRRPTTLAELCDPPVMTFKSRATRLISNVLFSPLAGPVAVPVAFCDQVDAVVVIFHPLTLAAATADPFPATSPSGWEWKYDPTPERRWSDLAEWIFIMLGRDLTITLVDLPSPTPLSTRKPVDCFLDRLRGCMVEFQVDPVPGETLFAKLRFMTRAEWEAEVGPEDAQLQAVAYCET